MQRSYPSSRLSRNELYSHGFKEGQPWADDRRSLEAALQAMDRLELDIQQNYIERQSSPYSHNFAAAPPPPSPSRHYFGGPRTSRHYHAPQYPTPDVRIARSNDSGSSAGAPQLSREWSSGGGNGNGYGYGPSTGRRSHHRHTSSTSTSRSGWQVSDQPPPVLHRSSGWAERYVPPPPPPQQYYPPPLETSPSGRSMNSSYLGGDGSESYYDPRQQSQQQQQYQQYRSPAPTASRISSRHSGDSRTQPMSPSQWQVSRVVNGRGETYEEDRDPDEEQQHYQDYRGPSSVASPNWSTVAARDDTSEGRQLSVASSPGMYSEASLDSGYTRSSGYAESFDASPYSDEHPGYGSYGERDRVFHSGNDDRYPYHEAVRGPGNGELYAPEDEAEYVYGEEEEVYSDRGGYSDGGYSDGGSYSDGDAYEDEYD
ncbi:hypothetical protein D9619_000573 [Psilocybe cf. subviscida]|uniref:Uncharacterized protein n=1 Tax=Psilocybe cf. subviscida TaxID=2480587 RepID=A0A8H5BED2_9AGAR|nr:hypothetical protein D9619_000573 [Psilocybe cf. subviscida]